METLNCTMHEKKEADKEINQDITVYSEHEIIDYDSLRLIETELGFQIEME